jgi:AcrR family transcriptional regulator
MGRLINREKRERAKRERAEKKQRILAEARSTFMRLPFVEATLDTIGQQAGVDRGVASMFFRTREELFLLLAQRELEVWFDDLEDRLAGDDPWGVPAPTRALADSLAERHELCRFLSLLPVVLEQNVEAMEVFRFQRWRRDRMEAIGAAIDGAGEGLPPGTGFRLLYLAQLLVAGLEPAARPRGSAAYEKHDPDFAGFWIDLGNELAPLLEAAIPRGAP